MYTIALLAQKGGTGKTTLAVHVAADFEGAGGSAALVDLDPQASAALWGDKRGRSPFVGAVPAARRSGALAALGPVRGGGVPPQQGGWRDPRLQSVAAPPTITVWTQEQGL